MIHAPCNTFNDEVVVDNMTFMQLDKVEVTVPEAATKGASKVLYFIFTDLLYEIISFLGALHRSILFHLIKK